MKTQEHWNEMQRALDELVKTRNSISKQIHDLQMKIRQHKTKFENSNAGQKSLAYQMFGKRLKDLTPEEYREYYNARQRVNRENRKNGIYKKQRKEVK